MPQTWRLAINGILLLVLVLPVAGTSLAGFWQKLDAFFAAPRLDPAHDKILAEEGWRYLEAKRDVFVPRRPVGEIFSLGAPAEEALPGGARLVEVLGAQDFEVEAVVYFDSGSGYSYAPGDSLLIRLYAAALVRHGGNGALEDYRTRVLALRNMSNPASRDGETDLIADLQASSPFTTDERARLAENLP
jgi:hypothetical protein